jgi:hypothetical protein
MQHQASTLDHQDHQVHNQGHQIMEGVASLNALNIK